MRPTLILGWVFAGLIFAAVVIFAYSTLRQTTPTGTGTSTTAGPNALPYSIVVDADGQASGPPDVAYVTLGVDTTAPGAQDATNANAQAMSAVISAVKSQNVADADVRTQDFSVTPVYATQRPGDTAPPTITGYRVRNTARVT